MREQQRAALTERVANLDGAAAREYEDAYGVRV